MPHQHARIEPAAPAAGHSPRRAGVTRVAAWVDRHPVVWVVVMSVLAYAMTDRAFLPADQTLFVRAGQAWWRADFTHVLSATEVQSGPLGLAYVAATAAATDWLPGVNAAVLVLSVLASVCLLAVVRMTFPATGWRRGAIVGSAGIMALLFGLLSLHEAHPTHPLMAVLWLAATQQACRDHAIRVGLLMGVACGFDTWGVLAAGLILVLPTWEGRVRATLCAAVVTAAVWLPVIAFGQVRSFGFRWPVADGSLPALLGLTTPGWSYRAAQGLAALGVGALIAMLLGRRRDVVWLLPAFVVAVRLVTDPLAYHYYAIPLYFMVFAGLAMVVHPHLGHRPGPKPAPQRQTLGFRLLAPLGLAHLPGPDAARMALLAAAVLVPPVAALVNSGPLVTYLPTTVCLAVYLMLVRHPASRSDTITTRS